MQNSSRPSWQVGAIFGIPLHIDSSWLIIVVLATFIYGLDWQSQYPGWGPGLPWVAGLMMALLLFASVLCHELGHSLVARAQGTKVNSITLFIFGGLASLDTDAKTPEKAFQVAIAGPAVSFGLSFLLTLGSQFLTREQPLWVLSENLATINLVLALFNLIPGLPLDGGQILKAAVWKVTGNRFQGVRWAAKAGQFLGWVAIAFGCIIILLTGNLLDGGWIAMLGLFGLRNANTYDRFTDLQEMLLAMQASEAMTRDFRVVKATQTLHQFTDDYLSAVIQSPIYFAASDGRYRGWVDVDRLQTIERSQWEQMVVQDITTPLLEIPSVREKTPLVDVIARLENEQLPRITVLSPADAVAGVIDRGDIVRAVTARMNVLVASTDIKRIKDEGEYPPNLRLGAIARTIIADQTVEPQPTHAIPTAPISSETQPK